MSVGYDISLYIQINSNFGPRNQPVVVLRKVVSRPDTVQHIFNKAVNDDTLIAKPRVRNPELARLKLLHLGFLKK